MSSWGSYPKIYALGHRAIRDLTQGPVLVEEKIDGSQFSFGVFNGQVRVKSKNQEFPVNEAPDLFRAACLTVVSLTNRLVDGWTYRGEVLHRPKHNVLAYDRVPNGHIILFDIQRGHEDYLPYGEKQAEASRLGLECVPLLHAGMVSEVLLRELLARTSVLGGQRIEGVVLKPGNYLLFGEDKKVLLGKYVSEAFKEAHRHDPNWAKHSKASILETLVAQYKATPRWQKAVQHLREQGLLQGAPQDIPLLMREVLDDLKAEESDAIKDVLFKHYWKDLARGVTAGLPEWWKSELLKEQFEEDAA